MAVVRAPQVELAASVGGLLHVVDGLVEEGEQLEPAHELPGVRTRHAHPARYGPLGGLFLVIELDRHPERVLSHRPSVTILA